MRMKSYGIKWTKDMTRYTTRRSCVNRPRNRREIFSDLPIHVSKCRINVPMRLHGCDVYLTSIVQTQTNQVAIFALYCIVKDLHEGGDTIKFERLSNQYTIGDSVC